jgi:hypothetical protein
VPSIFERRTVQVGLDDAVEILLAAIADFTGDRFHFQIRVAEQPQSGAQAQL